MQSHGTTEWDGSYEDLLLVLECAADLVAQLRGLSHSFQELLEQSASPDEIISLLQDKKSKVDTLMNLAREIRVRLRVDESGVVGIAVPENLKRQFKQFMADLKELVDEESRIEELICDHGLPVSRRVR